MKKAEKWIVAALTITLGILLMILKADVIKVAMTAIGLLSIAFGVLDLYEKRVPPAVIKIVVGISLIFCGWAFVYAVLYVLAAALVIIGVLLLYEKFKSHPLCDGSLLQTIFRYATAAVCLLIGVLLFFNQKNTADWVFVISGLLMVVEGGLLAFEGFIND